MKYPLAIFLSCLFLLSTSVSADPIIATPNDDKAISGKGLSGMLGESLFIGQFKILEYLCDDKEIGKLMHANPDGTYAGISRKKLSNIALVKLKHVSDETLPAWIKPEGTWVRFYRHTLNEPEEYNRFIGSIVGAFIMDDGIVNGMQQPCTFAQCGRLAFPADFRIINFIGLYINPATDAAWGSSLSRHNEISLTDSPVPFKAVKNDDNTFTVYANEQTYPNLKVGDTVHRFENGEIKIERKHYKPAEQVGGDI